jgi:hypothetical protein
MRHGMKRYLLCVLIAFLAHDCYAEGLDTLIEAGKSQAEIQKEYAKETKAFEKAKKALANNAVTAGMSKDDLRKECGEPVVIVSASGGKSEKWLYKPASSTFFKGPKISLLFGDSGLLEEIKTSE